MNTYPSRYSSRKRACSQSKKIFAYTILLTFFHLPSLALAALPYCSDFFPNGLQNHSLHWDNYMRFPYNASLQNASQSVLNTPTVMINQWSLQKSCGDAHCTAAGSAIPGLTPPEFLTTSSAATFAVPAHKILTIGTDAQRAFRQVTLAERATGIFALSTEDYVIDHLDMSYKSTLRLPSGTYWVRQLTLEAESKIEVVGAGPVTLYVMDSVYLPIHFRINENTRDPSRLALYFFNDAHFYVGTRTFAFVHTFREFHLGYRGQVTGGVSAAIIEMGIESRVTFAPSAAQAVAFNGLCLAH